MARPWAIGECSRYGDALDETQERGPRLIEPKCGPGQRDGMPADANQSQPWRQFGSGDPFAVAPSIAAVSSISLGVSNCTSHCKPLKDFQS